MIFPSCRQSTISSTPLPSSIQSLAHQYYSRLTADLLRPCHRSSELPCACAPPSIGSPFLASTKSRVLPPCRYVIFRASRPIGGIVLTVTGTWSSLPCLFGARRHCLGHSRQMLPTVRHACQLKRQSMSSMCHSGCSSGLADLLNSTRTNIALSLHSGLV